MVVSTVFPEMVLGFASAITQAVEAGEFEHWSPVDASQFVAACREVRLKVESFGERLRQTLSQGVDVATFKETFGRLLPRWETLASEMERAGAMVPDTGEVFGEFTLLVRAVSEVRDLLQRAFDAIATPRLPLDWRRVHDAQAAYRKGDTKPFQGAQDGQGNW